MSKFDEQIIVVNRDILFNKDKNAFNGFFYIKIISKEKKFLVR